MEKTTRKREIAFALLFVLIFTAVLTCVTIIFYPKWESGTEKNPATGFYEEEENSLDVILLGSCNMYTSFNPALFWERTGVTSYGRTCPDQTYGTSYYLLKEALKTQSPKVVALEALFLTNTDSGHREYYNREAIDYLPASFNKLKLAKSLVDSEVPVMQAINSSSPGKLLAYAGYIFPLLRYHSRDDITTDDFSYFSQYEANLYNKGAVPQYSYCRMDGMVYDVLRNGDCIREDAKKYLPKIKQLCDENGIELVVVKSPNRGRWDEENTALARDYTESLGIEFVDMQDEQQFEEYNEWDYQNGNRLNVYGMLQFTNDFGDYLVERYSLTPTELSESSETLWEESVDAIYAQANEKGMSLDQGQICQKKCEDDSIMIRWNKYLDCDKYAVYKKSYSGDDFTKIAEVEGDVYFDAECGHSYYYWYCIEPLEGAHKGDRSKTVTALFVEAVTDFTAERTSDGSIELTWSTNGLEYSSFSIQRRCYGDITFTEYDVVDGSKTSYLNQKVSDDEVYFYRILGKVSREDAGMAAYSDSRIAECGAVE